MKGGNADKFELHVFGDIVRSGKKQNCAPRRGRKHNFENVKFDVYADCDNLKIREKRKKAPGCSGKHFVEGAMFELRFQRNFLKKS